MDEECGDKRERQFSAGEKTGNGDRDFLEKKRQQRADKSENDRHAQ